MDKENKITPRDLLNVTGDTPETIHVGLRIVEVLGPNAEKAFVLYGLLVRK